MDQASADIRAQIGQLGNQLRDKHPWLVTRQNALGGGIMVLALMLMAFGAYGYLQLNWPAWITVIIVAIATSFIHELEHDLIHYAYFKKRPVAHNLMLLVCWLTRPGTVNPWIRRRLHLLHHKVSGTRQDIEERGITNGMPWSPLRLLMLCDGTLAMIFRHKKNRYPKHLIYTLLKGFVAYLPVGMLYFACWYGYLAFHVSEFFEMGLAWPVWFIDLVPMLDVLAVLLLWPFFIRSFCLNFISSNMHYYGDIEEKNIVQQTQVWTSKWLWPLHLFCFNFGSTHGIHHFSVKDPFYIRQAIAKDAHKIMKKYGVRFNDYATFKRANRYQLNAQKP